MLLHQIFNYWLILQLLLHKEALRSGPPRSSFITESMIHKLLSIKGFIVDQWPLINSVLEASAIVFGSTMSHEWHCLAFCVLVPCTQVERVVSRCFRILCAGPISSRLYGRLLLNVFEGAIELRILLPILKHDQS